MSDDDQIKGVAQQEKRFERAGKYKPLPRNKQTQRDVARIFNHGTERELMQYLRANGVNDDSPRFGEIVKLFREHAGKRR